MTNVVSRVEFLHDDFDYVNLVTLIEVQETLQRGILLHLSHILKFL